MPQNAFGYVPTPALVAPIEFTLRLEDYGALGGYVEKVRPVASLLEDNGRVRVSPRPENPWPLPPHGGERKA
jgi:6-hydroxynicotinate reductase